jgi:2-keto-4-pentenoate hydratase/2-oxohepta-3-ene-1,7-dioic acid hydratase in catechol pathway
MLNVAVNCTEHGAEMARGQGLRRRPGAPPHRAKHDERTRSWERRATRAGIRMFLKAPSAVTANGESIRLPVGRTEIDWECELGVVVGRLASHVPAAQAKAFIFGYTLENDVSDRGSRGDRRFGSDWLIGKSHDTFAPMGPFIVPKEFVADPQKLPIKVLLNGQPFQEGTSSQMIHDVYEQIEYGSNIMTLRPGDV